MSLLIKAQNLKNSELSISLLQLNIGSFGVRRRYLLKFELGNEHIQICLTDLNEVLSLCELLTNKFRKIVISTDFLLETMVAA